MSVEPTTLLRTKLHLPRIRSDTVPRPRLMQKLDHGLDRRLTLVSAAAGMGKSTLLAQWLEHSDRADDFVLVLDDYHTIDDEIVHQILARLIDHMPRNMHLVLTCRTDPPLPLAQLRARSEVTEIRSHDLRFTSEEAYDFLQSAASGAVSRGWLMYCQSAPKAGSLAYAWQPCP